MPSQTPRKRRVAAILAAGLLPALLPMAMPAAPVQAAPEGVVEGAGADGAIAGKYIVVMRPGLGATAQTLVGTDRVRSTYDGLSAFSARLSPVEARRLAANPAVSMVEQDRVLRIATTQTNPDWHLDRVDQRSRTLNKRFTPSNDGSAVHAYVIDTGVRITHQEFQGRASYGADFVNQTNKDCNGHGTHVAGTIGGATTGVAKKVRIVAVRVLNCTGSGSLESVLNGVNWVTRHAVKPAVANMSLGSDRSKSLDLAVARSIASGVTYAVAAGNENRNAKYYSPADVTAAITVGATNASDRRASFSNYGSLVDIFAPGVDIWSAYYTSNNMYAKMSGTSMASPMVAGAAALALDANPTWTPAKVRDYLVSNATTGTVGNRGTGSPSRELYVTPPPAAPVIKTSSLATATVGSAYGVGLSLTASRRGTWRVSAGTLPSGLSLSSAGRLTGTPTVAGSRVVKISFTDWVPTTVTRQYTITVRPAAPQILTSTLADGIVGGDYYSELATADGRAGTWSIAAGVLPAGVTLSESGILSGTPESAGSYSVQFRFTDEWNRSVLRTLPLTVGAP